MMNSPAQTSRTDVVEKLEGSTIQHGKYNDRVYLMKLGRDDLPDLIPRIESLCRKREYSKIFAKVPSTLSVDFLKENYQREAYIPGFFRGREDAVFLTKYFSTERKRKPESELAAFRSLLEKAPAFVEKVELDSRFTLRPAGPDDVEDMADLYRQIFPTYPFPIHDPEYLLETMKDHVYYYSIWEKGHLVGLSSAETERESLSVEMTDFATLPEVRGNRLAFHLLLRMEEDLREKGFRTAYTIARLKSMGINKTFMKAGYRYSGTLVNNTNIGGGLESMNVWYRSL